MSSRVVREALLAVSFNLNVRVERPRKQTFSVKWADVSTGITAVSPFTVMTVFDLSPVTSDAMKEIETTATIAQAARRIPSLLRFVSPTHHLRAAPPLFSGDRNGGRDGWPALSGRTGSVDISIFSGLFLSNAKFTPDVLSALSDVCAEGALYHNGASIIK
jgi:hypothetical protein